MLACLFSKLEYCTYDCSYTSATITLISPQLTNDAINILVLKGVSDMKSLASLVPFVGEGEMTGACGYTSSAASLKPPGTYSESKAWTCLGVKMTWPCVRL